MKVMEVAMVVGAFGRSGGVYYLRNAVFMLCLFLSCLYIIAWRWQLA